MFAVALKLSLIGFVYVFAVFILIYSLVYAIGRMSKRFSDMPSDEAAARDEISEPLDSGSSDDFEKVAAVAAAYYLTKKKSIPVARPLVDNSRGDFSSWRMAAIRENYEITDIRLEDRW